jgi:hypothetical protein
LFFLDGEPIRSRTYRCACFFRQSGGAGRLEFRHVRFDIDTDSALDADTGSDLLDAGLDWAAALVPLVTPDGPLDAEAIALHDYDLRQLLGRDTVAEARILEVYRSCFDGWDDAVRAVVAAHRAEGRPFAAFYHSILALDHAGVIHILQCDGALPDLARQVAAEGMAQAGVLDSGGSCALYDVSLATFLNHGWYYREARGALLVFELSSSQRVPDDRPGSWAHRRTGG